MSGIVFFRSGKLEAVKDFYVNRANMTVWLTQQDCVILRHDNLLLGFCQRERPEREGMVCLYYPDRASVDRMYAQMRDVAVSEPKLNEKYQIYHFFARDPEERNVEFQCFLHQVGSL